MIWDRLAQICEQFLGKRLVRAPESEAWGALWGIGLLDLLREEPASDNGPIAAGLDDLDRPDGNGPEVAQSGYTPGRLRTDRPRSPRSLAAQRGVVARNARLRASGIAAAVWVLLTTAYWPVALALLGLTGRRAEGEESPFLPEGDPVLVLGGAWALGMVLVAVALGMRVERLRDWRSALFVAAGPTLVMILQIIFPGLWFAILLGAIATLALARSTRRPARDSGQTPTAGR